MFNFTVSEGMGIKIRISTVPLNQWSQFLIFNEGSFLEGSRSLTKVLLL